MYVTGYRFIEGEGSRVTVFGQDQNELSFLLSFGIVSIIYLLIYSTIKQSAKILLLLLALIYTFVILTTGSRMGLILLIFIGATLIFMNIKSARVVIIIPFVLLIGLAFYEYLPSSITERLSQIPGQIKHHDLTGRVEIWKMGLLAFKNENVYILGIGFNTFQSLLETKFNWSASSHNTYLCTFIELGILGSLIFSGMLVYLLSKVFYLIRNISVFFILLILPLLTTMFVLGISTRRWLFLIGVLIIKIWQFAKEEAAVG
jgi:O-antigen ligase